MHLNQHCDTNAGPNETATSIQFYHLAWMALVILVMLPACGSGSESPSPTATPFVIPSPTSVGVTDPPDSTPSPSYSARNPPEEGGPDYRLGYVSDRVGCRLMTEIVALVLEREWTLQVDEIPYGSTEDMFDSVSGGNVDLTLCFTSPEDDPLWRDDEKFGQIKQIGSTHWQDENHNKWRIVAKLSVKSDLRRNHQDLFCFFEKIKFSEMAMPENDAQEWVKNHNNDIQSWLNGCK